ncbi:MAG: ATP-binding protein [Ruminococcus sp.]
MNGCRIGAADGSYQKELLEKWLDSNQIQAEVVVCKGYDEMIEKLDVEELDTGIGMSEEFLDRIFDEFSQENDGARTSYKGTGLGMAIDDCNQSCRWKISPGTVLQYRSGDF